MQFGGCGVGGGGGGGGGRGGGGGASCRPLPPISTGLLPVIIIYITSNILCFSCNCEGRVGSSFLYESLGGKTPFYEHKPAQEVH